MKRPFLTIGLTFLCTMLLLFSIGTLYTGILAAILLAVCGFIVFSRHREASPLVLAGIAVLLAVSSFSYVQDVRINTALLYCGENISVTGTLADYPEQTSDRFLYRIDNCTLGNAQTSFSLHLSDSVYYDCKPGDVLSFTALKLYPSAEKDSQYYYSTMADGVYLRAYAEDVSIEPSSGTRLRDIPKEVRHNMLNIIRSRLSATQSGILSGLMLGNTDQLDMQTAAAFSTSGISHLFAVSGFHVSFWTGSFLYFFGKRKKHILPTITACAFLFFFMATTGFSVSVCRSGLMLGIIFLGNIFRREADSLNSLGFALTVLLLQNPFSAADASLLLSAAATAAIILSSRPIEDYIITPFVEKIRHRSIQKCVRYVASLLCLSATITLALLPLTSILFGSVSLMTPIANVLCIPTAQGAMILGTAAQLSNPIPYFSDFLFRLTEILMDLLLFFTKTLADIPVAIFTLNTVSTVTWAAVSLLLIAAVHKKYNRQPRRAFITALSSALSLFILFNIFCFTQKGDAVLTVFDTGNATCITICDNNGNAAVIGCGGDAYIAESVADNLRTYGIAQPRLLLIPDQQETENANAYRFSNLLQPEQIVSVSKSTDNAANLTQAQKADILLWENAALHFESTANIRAAHLSINEKDIIICFYPSSDFTQADAIYNRGDILICRQSIPQTIDTSRFSRIFISSDKEEQLYHFSDDLADKILTTADEGRIEIKLQK